MVNRMGRVHAIHLIGIGGVGMSGIAEVLINLGYQVSGSDLRHSPATHRLQALGATVYEGHHGTHVTETDVVVVSSAIDRSNPEVAAALAARIPVIPRAQMLAELMRFKHGIAVAGTHGKTTTTSLAAAVLGEAGLDPTYIIGGKLNQADTNARLGSGDLMVAEADESDASFLFLKPMTAIVTNIDMDHMATYGGDFERLKDTFVQFLQNLPFYGLVIACIDDPVVAEILPKAGRASLTYGFTATADYRATEVRAEGLATHFRVTRPARDPLVVTLSMPGRHNVLNALSVIALADTLNVDDDALLTALAGFQGVGRRCQVLGQLSFDSGLDAVVMDDYGHHPRELAVTFEAVRQAFTGRRLLSVFQPHRYSRTRDLFDDFVRILGQVDCLVLLDVYPAGEKPIIGAESKDLASAIRALGGLIPVVEPDLDLVVTRIQSLARPGDVILIQGAGSVGRIPAQLMATQGGHDAVVE
ncbi:MAG: UDP-N-acetylmuramate--L-alanine ligase [Litorivicinaceae bacterium]